MNDWLISRLLPGSRQALLGKLSLCVGLTGCLLGGCVVLPVAPYSGEPRLYGSGRALADGVPSSIVVGKTTRTEVLKELGPAEVEAADGSWLYYESDFAKDEKGYWVYTLSPVFGNIGHVATSTSLFRRLLVRFSGDSVVASANFYAQQCEKIDIGVDRRDPPAEVLQSCEILKQGVEMRQQRENERLAAAVPAADGPTERFDSALWRDGATQLSDQELRGTGDLNCRSSDVFDKGRGILAISSRALIFLPRVSVPSGAPPDPIRVPLADIAATREIRSWLNNTLSVDVRRHDGSYVSFTVCGRVTSSVHGVRTARAALEKRLSKSPE